MSAYNELRGLLDAVEQAREHIELLNRSNTNPLALLQPCGRHIRALEQALDTALHIIRRQEQQ